MPRTLCRTLRGNNGHNLCISQIELHWTLQGNQGSGRPHRDVLHLKSKNETWQNDLVQVKYLEIVARRGKI